jgi:thiol-disulfide isomerase/thioredoxin
MVAWLILVLCETSVARGAKSDTLSYEPTGCDGWSESGRLRGDGDVDAAVPLTDGRVLLVGAAPRSPQIFDPARGTVVSVAPGPWKFLAFASAAVVDDDTTLVMGAELVGPPQQGRPAVRSPICFAFHSRADTWDTISCPHGWAADTETFPTATRLVDGRVVAFDGVTGAAALDAQTYRWSDVVRVPEAIAGHSDVALATGQLLTVGTRAKQPIAFRFDAGTQAWSAASPLPSTKFRPRLLSLPDARVLARDLQDSSSTEIYDPARDAWAEGPRLIAGRSHSGAALLPDGSVVVLGGWDENMRRVPFAEVWRPGTDAWVFAGTNCVATQDPLVLATGAGVFAAGGLASDGFPTDHGFGFAMQSTARIERWDRSVDDLSFQHGLPPRSLRGLKENETAPAVQDWVGAAFPDLAVESKDGTRRISSWAGVRVVDVWATWCRPCLEGLPSLDATARRWETRGVEVILLSVDEDSEKVGSFRKGIHHAEVVWSDEARSDLGVNAIPALFVVGADGRVLAQHHGGGDVSKWLDAELARATQ